MLAPRLSTLTSDPPRRRFGACSSGRRSPRAGAASGSCSCPDWPSGCSRSASARTRCCSTIAAATSIAALATQPARAAEERLQLRLAVGAAGERLYLSFPRIEINESRPRVPSFYVLDIVRAIEGAIPASSPVAAAASRAGAATLAWPAPPDPATAIDEFEHDLVDAWARCSAASRRARAGPGALPLRAEPRAAAIAHRALAAMAAALGTGRRPGPSCRRRRAGAGAAAAGRAAVFAVRAAALCACPYQFLSAHLPAGAARGARAAAADRSVDPRRSLPPHSGAAFFVRSQEHGLLPLTAASLAAAQKMLDWAVGRGRQKAYDTWRRPSIACGATRSPR